MILQKMAILLLFGGSLVMLGWQDMIKLTKKLKIKLVEGESQLNNGARSLMLRKSWLRHSPRN